MADTFAGLPMAAPDKAGFDGQRLNRIDATMARAVDERRVPGVATVIARHGQVVHHNVVGRLDADREGELAHDSLFRMYSQTKPVTSAVLMTLFEEGHFFLDDPISKWLPEFANRQVAVNLPAQGRVRGAGLSLGNVEPARREITIFDLLTMTSGLPGLSRTPSSFWPLLEPAWEGTGFVQTDTRINDPRGSYEDMILALAAVPLFDHPGQTWNYGSDFDVLSLLLTRLTGKDLDSLFRERIFEPLSMTQSAFYCAPDQSHRLVTDHQWNEQGQLDVRDRPEDAEKATASNRKLMSGNGLFGGMLSTPPDYARFAQMLLNGGELDGKRVLGRKTVELMTMNHIGERNIDIVMGPNYGFGLGVCVRKTVGGSFTPGSKGAFGWGGAAGTYFFVDPAEDLFGLFFTHVFGYQFLPTADLMERFEKLTYEALK